MISFEFLSVKNSFPYLIRKIFRRVNPNSRTTILLQKIPLPRRLLNSSRLFNFSPLFILMFSIRFDFSYYLGSQAFDYDKGNYFFMNKTQEISIFISPSKICFLIFFLSLGKFFQLITHNYIEEGLFLFDDIYNSARTFLKQTIYYLKMDFMFLASMELCFISTNVLKKEYDLILNSLSFFTWILGIPTGNDLI